jgi:Na+/proline symporter
MPFDYELLVIILLGLGKFLVFLVWFFIFAFSTYFALSDDKIKTHLRLIGWFFLISWLIITVCICSGKIREDNKESFEQTKLITGF